MFRVVFFVDDRKLGESLVRLQGLAQGAPEVQPLANAKVGRNGQLVAETSGTIQDQFLKRVRDLGVAEVNARLAGEFLKSIGRSPSNATSLLSRLAKIKMLHKVGGKSGRGNRATYRVVAPKREEK